MPAGPLRRERCGESHGELIAEGRGRERVAHRGAAAARANGTPDDAAWVRPGPEVQIVLVEHMCAQRELPRPVGPRRRAASCCDTRAVVEQAAGSRRPRGTGRRRDADEIVDERRYAATSERIRSPIALTLGRMASSSVGL